MQFHGRFERGYDAYDEDADAPVDVYVNRLNLVLAGPRIFLVDETSHTDISDEVRIHTSDDIVIRPLSRGESVDFARYMDSHRVLRVPGRPPDPPSAHPFNEDDRIQRDRRSPSPFRLRRYPCNRERRG